MELRHLVDGAERVVHAVNASSLHAEYRVRRLYVPRQSDESHYRVTQTMSDENGWMLGPGFEWHECRNTRCGGLRQQGRKGRDRRCLTDSYRWQFAPTHLHDFAEQFDS